MKQTPLVTVLLPYRDVADYLHFAIESVLRQTVENFELFLINDGSIDDGPNIAEQYRRSDSRIRTFDTEGVGAGAACNSTIPEIRGQFIARQDGDDISLSNRLELELERFDTKPELVAVGGSMLAFTPSGLKYLVTKPTSHVMLSFIQPFAVPILNPTLMLRRSAFLDANGYDFNPNDDIGLHTRVGSFGLIENLEEVVVLYRRHDSQTSPTLRSPEITAHVCTRRREYVRRHSRAAAALYNDDVHRHLARGEFVNTSVVIRSAVFMLFWMSLKLARPKAFGAILSASRFGLRRIAKPVVKRIRSQNNVSDVSR